MNDKCMKRLKAEGLSTEPVSRTTNYGGVFVAWHEDGSVCLHIPQDLADQYVKELSEMTEMYEDETRDDWWDADDIARWFAEDMYAVLTS